MKYQLKIDINLPRKEVIRLFDDTENLYKWQPELLSFEPVDGPPGEVGSTSRLRYKMGAREVEMIETITLKEFPVRFEGTYEAKGVFNVVKNQFIEKGNSTCWIVDQEFKFSGFMSLMALFMKKAFQKQSRLYLERFKAFAEGN